MPALIYLSNCHQSTRPVRRETCNLPSVRASLTYLEIRELEQLFGWLIHLLVNWLIGWLVYWLVD